MSETPALIITTLLKPRGFETHIVDSPHMFFHSALAGDERNNPTAMVKIKILRSFYHNLSNPGDFSYLAYTVCFILRSLAKRSMFHEAFIQHFS